MAEEKTEGERIFHALRNALILMMAFVVLAVILGREFFGGIISIMGLALFALLLYAIR